MSVRSMMRSLGAGLTPVRRMDLQNIGKALKHPAKTLNDAIASRECTVLMFSSNDVELTIHRAIRYSNIAFSPELKLGWFILPGTQKTFGEGPVYIAHPDIPYTLDILPAAKKVNLNEELQRLREEKDPVIEGLGLPKNLLQLTCSSLARLASDKWLSGFDEAGGSGVVFLFGGAAGIAVGLLVGVVGTLAALALFANATQ